MRVETLELLRCPADHPSSPLITVANARDGDRLIDGALGCPVCSAEFALRDGIVYFVERSPSADAPPNDGDVMRLAALLGLTEPGTRVALCGEYALAAATLDEETGALSLCVNGRYDATGLADQIEIDKSRAIPLERGALAGLAVDRENLPLLSDASRVVRVGGRVVAPVDAHMPPGCRELARDAREWVAEVEATVSAPVTIRRA